MSVYNCHILYTCIWNFRWAHLVSLGPLNCFRSDSEDDVVLGAGGHFSCFLQLSPGTETVGKSVERESNAGFFPTRRGSTAVESKIQPSTPENSIAYLVCLSI